MLPTLLGQLSPEDRRDAVPGPERFTRNRRILAYAFGGCIAQRSPTPFVRISMFIDLVYHRLERWSVRALEH